MSFFVGEDNAGRSVVHITKGSYDLASMKSGVQPDTVLHNDLTFLSYELHAVTLQVVGYRNDGRPYYCDSVHKSNGSSGSKAYQVYASTGFSQMASATLVYLLDSNKQPISESSFKWYKGHLYPYSPTLYDHYLMDSRDALNYIPLVYASDSTLGSPCTSTNKIVDISYVLIMNEQKLIYEDGVTIAGSSSPGGTRFIAGGLDISNIKYVSKGVINNHPLCTVLDNYYQLIDASLISGSMEIISSELEGTVIRKGGYNIIDASSGLLGGTGTLHNFTVTVNNSSVYLLPAVTNNVHLVKINERTKVVAITGSNTSDILYSASGRTKVYTYLGFTYKYWYVVLYYEVVNGSTYLRQASNNYGSSTITMTVEVFA